MTTTYDNDNIFAKILRGEAPCHNLFEDEETFVFLNIMPESKGHSLVIPKFAAADIYEIEESYLMAMARTSKRMAAALREAFRPDGMFVYQLNGAVAGQTVFHIHMHLVPRYKGVALRSHEEGMEAGEVLEEQAEKIRAALKSL
ncbi:MAG: HIT family protein [Hyphomicrobiales bacterium]|nr:HIT family protein [Hyphomicrobiales bacterium]